MAYNEEYVENVIQNLGNKNIDDTYRYRLDIELKKDFSEGGERIVFILMNPSVANKNEDDPTTRNIISNVFKNESTVKSIVTLNTIPLKETYKNELNEKLDNLSDIETSEMMELNKECFRTTLEEEETTRIVIATGDGSSRKRKFRELQDEMYNHMYDIVDEEKHELFVFDINSVIEYGAHPQGKEYDLKQATFKKKIVMQLK
ncbi:DUF1643 domain-containing protein [Vagococcus carniphilus]|uniref:DUF1643 domain-containing protein n=1 Tax=Vagococcus carniphilus TaxID=218144 RepID=UPI00289097F0|nr:DUF1643 domain-containing protein [Vagococcus carniphilus]MDT2830692.1 DUF1643 domain-containing protein [Vagococcus carniphilus]MDT2839536.1 DUF1643 domain-containing protein [Vagococcus carniphilus]MDT2853855.1 DUF1643 domain-containing protein [Vagococcus carniphilus]